MFGLFSFLFGTASNYLYLNFSYNYDKGSRNRNDISVASLSEQYEGLKNRLGSNAPDTLRDFAECCFPPGIEVEYNISLPAFNRKISVNKKGISYINNIVIRPSKSMSLRNAVPDMYDVIIVGDINFGNVIDVKVKAVELIDATTAKFGEKQILCKAACSFEQKKIISNNKYITVPDYGTTDIHNPVLNQYIIQELCDSVYPVSCPDKAKKVFSDWEKYIEFRKYYLGNQSSKSEKLHNVEIADAYMVSRDVYKKNEDELQHFLLDDISDFAKGEQVILSKNVDGSEAFPLINVAIRKNKNEIIDNPIVRNGAGKPKYEARLRRYTNDSMGLSVDEPHTDDNGRLQSKGKQYPLGERYLFTYRDIEPDYTDINAAFEKSKNASFSEIDKKYDAIISVEVDKAMKSEYEKLKRKYDLLYSEYVASLAESPKKDAADNKDEEDRKAFEETIKNTAPAISDKKDDNDKNRSVGAFIDQTEITKPDEISKEVNSPSRKSFFEERNKAQAENKRRLFEISLKIDSDKIRKEKERQFAVLNKSRRDAEKQSAEEELKAISDRDIKLRREKNTIREYRIYFRPENATDTVKVIKQDFGNNEYRYLVCDDRAEKYKIERQEKALNALENGYVKNPYLASYLFDPESLAQITRNTATEPDWCLESLNDTQKLAVRRALASESIFLLQGPPGTGKTQVIAEITAQLAKRRKKVLISSETHKAIDNVFERLPKIPEIRPLRLIPSYSGKETNYNPERLVDNFYLNISGNLKKQIDWIENFEKMRESFRTDVTSLRNEYNRLTELRRTNANALRDRCDLIREINQICTKIEEQRGLRNDLIEEIDVHRKTIQAMQAYRIDADNSDNEFFRLLRSDLEKLLRKFSCFADLPVSKVSEIINADPSVIRTDINILLSNDDVVKMQRKKEELRSSMDLLRDDCGNNPAEGDKKYLYFKILQNKLKDLNKELKTVQQPDSLKYAISEIEKITSKKVLKDPEALNLLPGQITMFKADAYKIFDSVQKKVDSATKPLDDKLYELRNDKIDCENKKIDLQLKYEAINSAVPIEEYDNLTASLKQKINRFFRDFNIIREYESGDFNAAFQIIDDELCRLESEYRENESEIRNKITMYKDICKYLASPDILEEDRQAYTKILYENANVFGITCTSRDKFTKAQLSELGKYGIDDVDMRKQGIDVVIVDEVSKSSFLDLLIPILYGKTVILVGDHRQLPPMYDLRHMRPDDFEGLDEDIINPAINEHYTKLYEECFFKTLYEKVPQDFRVMLDKQYRCHSHIMEVFNHFYGGDGKGLTIGKKNQDDEKAHNLTVKLNGKTVIDPMHHVYFVDCDGKESSAYEGSTSKINEQEAAVVMVLLKCLNNAAGSAPTAEKPSAGVICTYGDQARLITKKRRGKRFEGFSRNQDEKLIISTVDDFQGDERDIIIVSMVRNPRNKNFNAEFVTKFERINVAFSRARKLLIIVGSREFLSSQTIELPDISGNHALDKHSFHVYKKIIESIGFRGKILDATDILGA